MAISTSHSFLNLKIFNGQFSKVLHKIRCNIIYNNNAYTCLSIRRGDSNGHEQIS